MNFIRQIFSFLSSWNKPMWQFRTRFINEYNAWIIEVMESEAAGWRTLCHRRTDADHDLMVVKFVSRSLAMEHAQDTGLRLNYKEVPTTASGLFRVQWQYRMRLELNSNAWVLETKETTTGGWIALFEYVSVAQRRGAFHRLPLHFDSYISAKKHAKKIGLDTSYVEVRFTDAAPSLEELAEPNGGYGYVGAESQGNGLGHVLGRGAANFNISDYAHKSNQA
jgi:hypothetical protein